MKLKPQTLSIAIGWLSDRDEVWLGSNQGADDEPGFAQVVCCGAETNKFLEHVEAPVFWVG